MRETRRRRGGRRKETSHEAWALTAWYINFTVSIPSSKTKCLLQKSRLLSDGLPGRPRLIIWTIRMEIKSKQKSQVIQNTHCSHSFWAAHISECCLATLNRTIFCPVWPMSQLTRRYFLCPGVGLGVVGRVGTGIEVRILTCLRSSCLLPKEGSTCTHFYFWLFGDLHGL